MTETGSTTAQLISIRLGRAYMAMVLAAEGESVYEYREAAEKLLMSVAEINRAQLRALMGAGALE